MKIKTITILMVMATYAGSAAAEGLPLRQAHALSGPSTAETASNAAASATTSSAGGAAQGVGSQGQSLSIDSHATYEAQARNPVATAVAPALSSSNDTCMGSTSVGGSAVSFGFSVGSTWTDANCVMLKNAREMWNMGFRGAALARLCMDDLNKEALESTGINCPLRYQSPQSAQADQVNNAEDRQRY
ncbi:MAG: hypothetical protein V7642_1529 [Burkholderiales bacterium]